MSKIKVNKIKGYTVMSNYHLMDKRLTLKSKGLLSLMLALPDNWDYSIKGLVAISVENETAIRSALKELEEQKYLIRTRFKNELGKFDYDYNIYEKPYIESPHIGKPYTENLHTGDPHTENQIQINTNKEITKEIITKEENNKELDKEIVINNNKEISENKTLLGNKNVTILKKYFINDDVINTFLDFIKMRKSIKKPMTDTAIELACKKLLSLSNNAGEQIAILNQSIFNSWQGLFELKDKNNIVITSIPNNPVLYDQLVENGYMDIEIQRQMLTAFGYSGSDLEKELNKTKEKNEQACKALNITEEQAIKIMEGK